MKYILSLLFAFSFHFAFGQKFDKFYKRLDEAFIQGDFKTAEDEFYSLSTKFVGKTVSFQDSIRLLYYESRLFRLKGDYNYSEELGGKYVARVKRRLGDRSPEFLQILLDKSRISIQSADYHSADFFLTEFFDRIKDVPQSDSELVFQGRFLQTQNELERGNLYVSEKEIENLIFKAENRLLQKKEVTDKKGRKKYVDFKDDELTDRRRDLVLARLFQVRLNLVKGDYPLMLKELEELKKLHKKIKMKVNDQSFIDYLIEYSRYYRAVDQPVKAIAKLKEAMANCGKKSYSVTYLKSHNTYLRMCEELMQLYVKQKDFNRAQDIAKEYKQIISQNYGEAEPFKVRLRIPFASSWEKKETSFIFLLEKSVKDIVNYHLPNQYAYDILQHLYQSCMYGDSVKKAEGYILNYIKLLEHQCGTESVYYMQQQCELANFYAQFTDRVNLSAPLFTTYLHKGLEKQLSPESNVYLDALNKEGAFFEIKDQFQKAINNYVQVQQLYEKRFGKDDWRVAAQSMKVGTVEMQMGEFPVAEEKYQAALSRLEKTRGKDSREYIECLQRITRLYIITGRYEEAETYLSRSIRTVKTASKASLLSFNGLDEELMLLLNKGLYTEAQEKTLALIDYRLKRYGLANHRAYITPYQIGAEVFLASGNYTTAEAMASKACQVSKAIFGDTSMQYLKSLAIFCRVYSAFGDYERAQDVGEKSVAGIEKYFGNAHVEISKPKTDLAMIHFYQGGRPELVYELLNKALEINRNKYGTDHPRYAESLQFIASFHISNKKYQEAVLLLDESDKIWVSKLGKVNTHSADAFMLRGEIDWALGNYEGAREYFSKAASFYKEVFNESHPRYISIMTRVGQAWYVLGKYDKALSVCELTAEKNLEFVKRFFPSMSDREKTKSWAMIRPSFEFYYTLALKYKDKKPSVLGKMFDIVLNTKAILLSASIKVRERILASGDQDLKNKFRDWTRKKEEITAAIELGPEERKLAGIDLRKMEVDAEELEIQLSKGSEDFKMANEEQKINWKSIRDILEKGEYAVEIVRFRYYDKGFSDSIIYAALLVNPKTRSNPDIIVLNHGRSMESKYINYYRNCVKFMLQDNLSYNVFWKPLKEQFLPGSKIYFSPDGVYNELNLESLRSQNGRFVIDEEDIDLISNSKDIFSAKSLVAKSSDQKNVAFLMGDPVFYSNESRIEKDDVETIAKLPGTREEVTEINKILKNSRWETKSYTGTDANEDIIKSVYNPRILHIATHGYFLEDLNDGTESSSFSMINQNKAVENPLLRSGLYLNKAGDIVDESARSKSPQLGDGLLTAYEAMNLNLNATDLVVLSACETGRGEVQVGEGVYGLQRAFQIAGAKAVIMSLFKVSDSATQELMNIFYRNWIGRGMDKRKAFIEAKKELMKTKPQPIYWGSFVMVGVG
jgi:CHAT domain-containing protein